MVGRILQALSALSARSLGGRTGQGTTHSPSCWPGLAQWQKTHGPNAVKFMVFKANFTETPAQTYYIIILVNLFRFHTTCTCAMVKTWYMGYGHPSHIGNPDAEHMNPIYIYIMDWLPIPFMGKSRMFWHGTHHPAHRKTQRHKYAETPLGIVLDC